MIRIFSSIALAALFATQAFAQAPPAGPSTGQAAPQPPSTYYPAPPPLQAPSVQQGVPTTGLSSPLPPVQKVERTEIAADTEAQLFIDARKIVWGRHAKTKGAKPGDVVVTKQGNLWTIKGRIDSVAPGTEGDWASIDGVVERISASVVQIRGEVAFRVAKVEKGTPCKVAGTLTFRRSGKAQVWRLAEGDNPCDGTREAFDLVYEKPVEKKPVPTQPKRS
jgi:hypothetical protein